MLRFKDDGTFVQFALGALELARGEKVPALMFFHIPLQEFRQMYESDAHARAHPELHLMPQHGVTGERNEDESFPREAR